MMMSRASLSRFSSALTACALVVLLGVILLSGCSREPSEAGTFFGRSQPIGQGTVRTFTTTDAAGHPTELGLRVSAAALDGLPAQDSVPPTMIDLDLPPQASSTVVDHVTFNWNSQGHDPVVLFGKPHFDFHFYMTDAGSVMAIDPSAPDFATKAAQLPDPRYVPVDYVPPPGRPADSAVPAMGLHWVDKADNMVPGQYNFQHAFINGSWDGKYTFMEPMMTREWMLTRATVDQPIKQPAAYQRTGYFPTTYSVRYDETANEYVISLGGLTMRQAS